MERLHYQLTPHYTRPSLFLFLPIVWQEVRGLPVLTCVGWRKMQNYNDSKNIVGFFTYSCPPFARKSHLFSQNSKLKLKLAWSTKRAAFLPICHSHSPIRFIQSHLSYQFYVVQELRAAINIHLLLFLFIYILSFSVSGFMELPEKSTPWTLEQSI